MKFAGDPQRFTQDETGQWWYIFGSRKARVRTHPLPCLQCGEDFLPGLLHRGVGRDPKYCSKDCASQHKVALGVHNWLGKREKSVSWKGGRRHNRDGYAIIHAPDHPRCQKTPGRKYVQEHVLVMEQMLGRYLEPHERVHHKNGIRDDNRPENLELWTVVQPYGVRHNEQQHCPTCRCFA